MCTDTHVKIDYHFEERVCQLIQTDITKAEPLIGTPSAVPRAYNCADVNITVFGYLTQEFKIVPSITNIGRGSCDLYRL